jgi:hypothetical protein
MLARTALIGFTLLFGSSALAESLFKPATVTLAGGTTIRASSTEHDTYRAEVNFGWKPEIWGSENLTLSLNHAISVMTFRDVNNVNAISWAPNIILTTRNEHGFNPYFQFGFGAAYFSDDQLKSDPKPHPRWTLDGVTDLGSHGQFESSLAIGLRKNTFSIRAKIYHYSNADIANKNEGIDVAEFGISYNFRPSRSPNVLSVTEHSMSPRPSVKARNGAAHYP